MEVAGHRSFLMTLSRAWLPSAAVASLLFGLNFPDPNLAGERAPLPHNFTVLAADEAPAVDQRQLQSEENADESAKMGEKTGAQSGDEGGEPENETKKVDQPSEIRSNH
jgi:hypothetical protein